MNRPGAPPAAERAAPVVTQYRVPPDRPQQLGARRSPHRLSLRGSWSVPGGGFPEACSAGRGLREAFDFGINVN